MDQRRHLPTHELRQRPPIARAAARLIPSPRSTSPRPQAALADTEFDQRLRVLQEGALGFARALSLRCIALHVTVPFPYAVSVCVCVWVLPMRDRPP